MDNIKERDISNIIEQCSELNLVGCINGKEEKIEIDAMTKAMIIGYLIRKNNYIIRNNLKKKS